MNPEQNNFDSVVPRAAALQGEAGTEANPDPQKAPDGRRAACIEDWSRQCEALRGEIQRLRQENQVLSREASGAELATATLHNIGNVLNSVNVSASLLGNRLRQSRVGNLGRALTLLREHQSHLAEFFSVDPKGKVLPAYLLTLAEHLLSEQAELVHEVETLQKNVDHIKEIVTTQQNYAKLCGVVEVLDLCELVRDAVRINQGALERHGIELVQDFEPLPRITVDKSKVLQILVNLIRNAKYALEEGRPLQKRLELHLGFKDAQRVAITVTDNGIGIGPENLARLFQYGFTTRRDGHGFGLHSSRQAARQMGGDLSVRSAGPGKGASFCLELPLQPPALKAAQLKA